MHAARALKPAPHQINTAMVLAYEKNITVYYNTALYENNIIILKWY